MLKPGGLCYRTGEWLLQRACKAFFDGDWHLSAADCSGLPVKWHGDLVQLRYVNTDTDALATDTLNNLVTLCRIYSNVCTHAGASVLQANVM